jgi:hypothetical protein
MELDFDAACEVLRKALKIDAPVKVPLEMEDRALI